MMRKSRIKAKLSQNQPALCTTITLAEPVVFELTSLMGFDGIWLDLEHHGHSVETAGQLMRAARVGTADIVARPAKGEFMRIGRLLEAGAQAIMYPRCDSAAEAAEVVRAAKFAPLGQRGFDGANADARYGGVPLADYVAHANRETLIIVQLENQCAVDQAEAIAAVPGVDFIMLGPGDFSILEGLSGNDLFRLETVTHTIARAASNAGKHWACTLGSLDAARQSLELGTKLIFFGADIDFIRQALERIQAEFGELGFSFGD
jgi:4-hydroxy-2-oxoheptanedioate aldolase